MTALKLNMLTTGGDERNGSILNISATAGEHSINLTLKPLPLTDVPVEVITRYTEALKCSDHEPLRRYMAEDMLVGWLYSIGINKENPISVISDNLFYDLLWLREHMPRVFLLINPHGYDSKCNVSFVDRLMNKLVEEMLRI